MPAMIDNFVEDWELVHEQAAGRPEIHATVELNAPGIRALAGLFAGDVVQFSRYRWIVHEIGPGRKTLVLRALSALDTP